MNELWEISGHSSQPSGFKQVCVFITTPYFSHMMHFKSSCNACLFIDHRLVMSFYSLMWGRVLKREKKIKWLYARTIYIFFLTKILLFEGLCISLHSSLRLSYAQNTPLVVTIAILQDKTLSLVVTCRDLMHRTKPAGPCLFTALLWIITSKNASGYALHIDTFLKGVAFGLRTSFSQLNLKE